MAVTIQRDRLDIDEQIIRIEKLQAELSQFMIETHRITQDPSLASPYLLLQGASAAAVLIGATLIFAKLCNF